jgi:hypothetical protein
VQDAAVAPALVAGDAGLLLEDDDRAGAVGEQRPRRRQPDEAGADDDDRRGPYSMRFQVLVRPSIGMPM